MRAQFTLNEQVIRRRRGRGEGGAPASSTATSTACDKWKLIRAVTEARGALGLSDRTIVVLEALVSFHPERALRLDQPLVVFPSNNELSMRTRGMAPATLRRHLAALVEAGLVLRRDSANGKRFACRDGEGRIASAFGFDLAGLVARAGEIERLAVEARAHRAAIRATRSEITIHLRDIAAMLRAAEDDGRAGPFAALGERFEALSGRLGRNTALTELDARRNRLVRLRAEVEAAWLAGAAEGTEEEPEAAAGASAEMAHEPEHVLQEAPVETGIRERARTPAPTPRLTAVNAPRTHCKHRSSAPKVSANGAQNERQIVSSDSEDSLKRKDRGFEFAGRTDCAPPGKVDSCQRTAFLAQPNKAGQPRSPRMERGKTSVPSLPPLASVLSACPQIADYGGGAIRDWRDLVKAADLVRTMLSVSGAAWMRARVAMGEVTAAVVMAAMLERAGEIESPGAYLQSLASRAEKGGFTVGPMLHALVSTRLRDRRSGTCQT